MFLLSLSCCNHLSLLKGAIQIQDNHQSSHVLYVMWRYVQLYQPRLHQMVIFPIHGCVFFTWVQRHKLCPLHLFGSFNAMAATILLFIVFLVTIYTITYYLKVVSLFCMSCFFCYGFECDIYWPTNNFLDFPRSIRLLNIFSGKVRLFSLAVCTIV